MKQIVFILFIVWSLSSVGQNDSLLKSIFFDLNLSLSHSSNSKILLDDKRFLTPKEAISSGDHYIYVDAFSYPYYYRGKVLCKSIIETKPDSTIVYLLESTGVAFCEDCGVTPNIYFTGVSTGLLYYYHSSDSLESAYKNFKEFLTSKKQTKLLSNGVLGCNDCEGIFIEDKELVDKKTLAILSNKAQGLINWPTLTFKKYLANNIYCLEIEFSRKEVR
jgi:hypothetical protein